MIMTLNYNILLYFDMGAENNKRCNIIIRTKRLIINNRVTDSYKLYYIKI